MCCVTDWLICCGRFTDNPVAQSTPLLATRASSHWSFSSAESSAKKRQPRHTSRMRQRLFMDVCSAPTKHPAERRGALFARSCFVACTCSLYKRSSRPQGQPQHTTSFYISQWLSHSHKCKAHAPVPSRLYAQFAVSGTSMRLYTQVCIMCPVGPKFKLPDSLETIVEAWQADSKA